MPRAAERQPRTTPEDATTAEPPNPTPAETDRLESRPSGKGALFRALVDAGADAVVAYTAEVKIESMVLEIAAAQARPIIMEMQRFAQEQNVRLDRMDARLDRMDARLDTLTQDGAARDRRLDVLAAQMRLMIAGLGVLVTVLIAVFGFLFTA